MRKLMAGDTGRRRYDAPSGVPAASVGHGPWSKRPATRVVLEARLRHDEGMPHLCKFMPHPHAMSVCKRIAGKEMHAWEN
jgi:hypothetical protein